MAKPKERARMPVKPVASRTAGGSPPRIVPSASPAVAPAKSSRARKDDHKILFQKYFKSIGPRTYAVQIKQSNNGNHYIILTEGKRDLMTNEVRKTRLFVYS